MSSKDWMNAKRLIVLLRNQSPMERRDTLQQTASHCSFFHSFLMSKIPTQFHTTLGSDRKLAERERKKPYSLSRKKKQELKCTLISWTRNLPTGKDVSTAMLWYWLPTCNHTTTQQHACTLRLRRPTAHWAPHLIQMAHIWLVPWPHIRME